MEQEKKRPHGRGVRVENRMPYDPENIRLSKAEFVKKQEAQKAKQAKIDAYSKELDKKGGIESQEENKKEAPKEESKPVAKKKGRPKKID